MSNLPQRIIPILRAFETVFSPHVWEWAKVLLIGAILAPGERTVAGMPWWRFWRIWSVCHW
jgi:hypothetical protein